MRFAADRLADAGIPMGSQTVLLKGINYNIVSSNPQNEVTRAVADSNNPAIIRAFNVAAFSPNGDPVIDVTSLYTTEIAEFSARRAVSGARGFDGQRSFIEKAVSFPQNINVEVTQTYTAPLDAAAGAGRAGAAGMSGNSGTASAASDSGSIALMNSENSNALSGPVRLASCTATCRSR